MPLTYSYQTHAKLGNTEMIIYKNQSIGHNKRFSCIAPHVQKKSTIFIQDMWRNALCLLTPYPLAYFMFTRRVRLCNPIGRINQANYNCETSIYVAQIGLGMSIHLFRICNAVHLHAQKRVVCLVFAH